MECRPGSYQKPFRWMPRNIVTAEPAAKQAGIHGDPLATGTAIAKRIAIPMSEPAIARQRSDTGVVLMV